MFRRDNLCYALTLLGLALVYGFGPPRPQADAASVDATQPRLELMRVPLTDLCWVLEKRSGIPHHVADTATGDLTVSVLGEMTVADLRQAVAETLGITWKSVGRGAERRYVAERRPEALAEAARVSAMMDRGFRDELRRLMAMASLPDEERKKLPPDLARRVEGNEGNAARLLGSLPAVELSRLQAGEPLVRPVDALRPAARAQLTALVTGLNATAGRFGSPAARTAGESRRIDLADGAPWSLRIARAPLSLPGRTVVVVTVFSPTSHGLSAPVNVSLPDLLSEHPQALRLNRATTTAAARVAEGFEVRQTNWDAILRDLAQALKRSIVSDAYLPDQVGSARGEASPDETVEQFLDRSCRTWRRRWGEVNAVLTFQSIEWPLKRRAQIPESVARRWRRQAIDTGRLTIDDLAEMAALSPHQMTALSWISPVHADVVAEHRHLLLWWKRLPIARWNMLAKGGLFLRDLPLAAQPHGRALLMQALGTEAPLELARARIRAETSEEAFTWSVIAPDREAVVRRLELRCRQDWVQRLKSEEEKRVLALRAAAGVLQ